MIPCPRSSRRQSRCSAPSGKHPHEAVRPLLGLAPNLLEGLRRDGVGLHLSGPVQRPQVLRIGGGRQGFLPAIGAAVGEAQAVWIELHPPDLPAAAVQFRVDVTGLVLFLQVLFNQHVEHSIPSLWKKSWMAAASAWTLPWAKPFRPPPRPERALFSRFTRGEISLPPAWTRA